MTFAPLERRLQIVAQAVTTAGNSNTEIAGEAPFACTVTDVTYTPKTAQAGAAVNSRTLTLYNRGALGTGVVVVAQLALVAGVNLIDNDERAIPLSGTPANLALAEGDILEWESLAVGTGIADPGGLVQVTVTRT